MEDKDLENLPQEENQIEPVAENQELEIPVENEIETPLENEVEPVVEPVVEADDDAESVSIRIKSEDDDIEIEEVADLELDLDVVEVSGQHDDFDWTIGRKNEIGYSEADRKKYNDLYDNTLNNLKSLEIVEGKVTAIHSGDVLIDLNYKSDGLVSLNEFRDRPNLAPGDSVEVYVESTEDKRGQLVLSRRKAKLLRAWDNIVSAFNDARIINGTVVSKTKGGLIVDVEGLETFLPGSQIDIKPITDYDVYIGKQMEFKVVKINEQIKNAVISHKALIESDLETQRTEIIAKLEKGQVLEGTVKNITDFGAFLDLGGVDGLLYITDISWGRIKHPSEALQLNQRVNVVVLDYDDQKRRISLGLKQLTPHPWEVLPETYVENSVVTGRIVNVEDYGAFVEIYPGVEGLIHISEVSWGNQPVNAREFFKIGADIDAKIVTIDREERKMSLSVKQLQPDPWSVIEEKYPKGSRHVGIVKNLTAYGVFVELGDGVGGMVHISDLSWTKRYSHPSEFTKVGAELDIMILDIDKENRKLSLGHKHLEENPWDTFESVFPVGSYHEATIVRKDDRGAVVQLPYGLEAYAPLRQLRKEDGNNAEVDETLMFKVLEFNRDDKRIVVSHSRYLSDIQKEVEEEEEKEKEKGRDEERKEVRKAQAKVEKTTLGELSAFSDLRKSLNMEEDKKDEE